MRRNYSYSKRDTLESCARRYFYEYYAAAKHVTFDEDRKEGVRYLKGLKSRHLWAGEILHALIQLRLTKGRDWPNHWFIRQAYQRFDRAVRASRNPSEAMNETYPPPLLSEFVYEEQDAEETAAVTRLKLATALEHFLSDSTVVSAYLPILSGSHFVEQKVSGLKIAEYSLDGRLDLVGRNSEGVDILDWKIGEDDDSSGDSLQLLLYSWWAEQKFKEPALRIRARKVFLASPEIGPAFQVHEAAIRRGRARVVQDIQMMEELDAFGSQGIEEAFTPCEKINVCRQCKYRGICSAGTAVTMSKPTFKSLPLQLVV
jgi:hypothetical protein